MCDPTTETFLWITERYNGINGSDGAQQTLTVLSSWCPVMSLTATVLLTRWSNEPSGRCLILPVRARFWKSFASIKLRSWSDAKTAASCGFSSWCKKCWSAVVHSLSVCLSVPILNPPPRMLLQGSLIFLWSHPCQSLRRPVESWEKYVFFFSFLFWSMNPMSGCLDVGWGADSGSLCSWAQDSTPPSFSEERAAPLHPGKAHTLQSRRKHGGLWNTSDQRKEPLFISVWQIAK